MNRTGLVQMGWMLSAAMMITACGGGGSSASPESTYVGTITGFGSVFVNGVEFETDSSSISVDGKQGTEDDLRVGMQVRVKGNANGTTGQATSIEFDDDVEGLVVSNSIPAGESVGNMNIMGHTVVVSKTTVFESKVVGVTAPVQVSAGMIVEVSGYTDGKGTINATRIEVKAMDLATYLSMHAEGIEVKGIVRNHDETNFKFDIGDMTVDYSSAVLDDMPSGSFDMLYVEVKSTAGIDGNTGELIASKVELESEGDKGHDGKDNEEVEIKGQITASINGNNFEIDGHSITVNEQTEYDDISKAGLLKGVMVEVEGYYINGEFIAEDVEGEYESSHEVSGTIVTIELTATNTGTITLHNDMVIEITSDTLMKDSRDDGYVPDQKFNLESLLEGDYVEVYFYLDNGTRIASKLEREDP